MPPTHSFDRLSTHARHALKRASDIARDSGAKAIAPEHLFAAIATERGGLGALFLGNGGFDEKAARTSFHLPEKKTGSTSRTAVGRKRLPLSPEIKHVLTRAYHAASRFRSPYVGTEHFTYALLESPHTAIGAALRSLDIDPSELLETLGSHLDFSRVPAFGKMFNLPDTLFPPKEPDETPGLATYTFDIGRDASERDEELYGRETELARIRRILGRRTKNNPLLIGEPGVGKTALVAALGRHMIDGEGGSSLADKRILTLDLALVVAGTNFRGEFESRLKDIVNEASKRRDIILFIDEIHTLIGAGNTQGGLDAANILKPALSRGDIRIIGATTLAEYKRHIEKDAALERRFQPVHIREMGIDETKSLLRSIRRHYESFHGVTIDDDAVETAVELAARHVSDRAFPDKAIDLLDEAASLAKEDRREDGRGTEAAALKRRLDELRKRKDAALGEGRYDDATTLLDEERLLVAETKRLSALRSGAADTRRIALTADHLVVTLAHSRGIPIERLRLERNRGHIRALGRKLRERIVGQEEAVSAVEGTILRASVGIGSPERPVGSFLFLGPTGVGKTMMARAIAEEFFGGAERLIRLDMSEFMERHNVAALIGAPAGYVGYGEGGRLTEHIRRHPASVVLFDEIEKAHPDVGNILLQILDDGMLTDAEGRRVSFRQSVVVLTSNLGTERFNAKSRIGFGSVRDDASTAARFDAAKAEVLRTLKKSVRPELLARIDHTIVFSSLDRDGILSVVRAAVAALSDRLATRGISLSVDEAAIEALTGRALSPDQGARLVHRVIRNEVERPLAEAMIASPRAASFSIRKTPAGIRCVPSAARGARRSAAYAKSRPVR